MCAVCSVVSVVSSNLQLHGLNKPWNSPGQNTGVGRPSLLQGIFPSRGSNPGLPHCGQILSHLNHQRRQCFISSLTTLKSLVLRFAALLPPASRGRSSHSSFGTLQGWECYGRAWAHCILSHFLFTDTPMYLVQKDPYRSVSLNHIFHSSFSWRVLNWVPYGLHHQ